MMRSSSKNEPYLCIFRDLILFCFDTGEFNDTYLIRQKIRKRQSSVTLDISFEKA